jgi:hypothetical protein
MPFGTRGLLHPRMLDAIRATSGGAFTAHGALTRAGTGDGTYNDTTGQSDPPARVSVHTGPVKVEPQTSQDRVVIVGGQPVTVRLYSAEAGLDWTDVRVDDVLVLSECDDPYLVGRPLTVVDATGSTLGTTRPFVVQDRLG